MGREVKRVPLDFNWPVKTIWPGYIMSLCREMEHVAKGATQDERCELCRTFAGHLSLPIRSFGCPANPLGPPAGDGWQMWETTSEGSPISPVFDTPETLARWLADNEASSFGSETATYDQWLSMITDGWAPLMVVDSEHGLRSGVEAATDKHG